MPCASFRRSSSILRFAQMPAEHEGDDERARDHERPARVADRPRPVDLRQVRQHVQPRQDAGHDRPDQERRGEHEVDERLGEERRREHRVVRALDPPLEQEELEDVPEPRGQHRVDADAGRVGAEDVAIPDLGVRVRGGEDVPPRVGADDELEDVQPERDREPLPLDRGELVEEDPRSVDDFVHSASR